jgi:hypothetical protein
MSAIWHLRCQGIEISKIRPAAQHSCEQEKLRCLCLHTLCWAPVENALYLLVYRFGLPKKLRFDLMGR